MKHIDLIKLMYDYREIIDKAYKDGYVESVDERLASSALFIKVGDKYKLNKNYINFTDSILQRVDYNIIFGDYEKEYNELVKNRDRYLQSSNEHYKKAIIALIEDLYLKFHKRDTEIQTLLIRLENDTSLDIDLLIEKANDILEKIDQLIVANERIGYYFRKELRNIDDEIDSLLQSISINILVFIENIDDYIKELNRFIIQTQKRRLQNKKMIELSNLIVDENVSLLDEYLSLNTPSFYHTINKSQRNKIHVFAADKDINRISKELKKILEDINLKKPVKDSTIKKQENQKIDLVNVSSIVNDLKEKKSDDIYMFIKSHDELVSYYTGQELKEESFKVFLQVTMYKNAVFDTKNQNFNDDNIRVAKWV